MKNRSTRKLARSRFGFSQDALRRERLRQLLERSVVAGLAPPGSELAVRRQCALPLDHPCRGGKSIAFARQVAMYLAHVGCGLSFTEAAGLYGRDRTTAAYGCRIVEEVRDDPQFDRVLDLLERCVRLGFSQIEPALAARIRKS